MNVQRDSLELRFQVRPSTFFQRCRDQQWYINHLLKKQWHHETEIKQLKDRLRRECSKSKHHSSSNATTTSGTSITEINPVNTSSASAISVGENCQLISVNLASTVSSSSTSYSSSSSSENAESYSGAKSKHIDPSKYNNKKTNNSVKSNIKSSKDKSATKYENLNNECDIANTPAYVKSNPLRNKRKDELPSDDLFSDLLQNIYANNVKVDSIDAISAGQSALPKVTALMSTY